MAHFLLSPWLTDSAHCPKSDLRPMNREVGLRLYTAMQLDKNSDHSPNTRGLMQKTALLPLALCACLQVVGGQTSFVVRLDSSQEVPPTTSTATGSGALTLNADNTLSYDIGYTNLAADFLAAHIHGAGSGSAAGVDPGATLSILVHDGWRTTRDRELVAQSVRARLLAAHLSQYAWTARRARRAGVGQVVGGRLTGGARQPVTDER